jgi:hypothetical protein
MLPILTHVCVTITSMEFGCPWMPKENSINMLIYGSVGHQKACYSKQLLWNECGKAKIPAIVEDYMGYVHRWDNG